MLGQKKPRRVLRAPYPHCDDRILHEPKSCTYCDQYPDRQFERIQNHIAFTGQYPPPPGWQPCPADAARPPGSDSDHRRWGGNKPTSALGDPTWPEESFGSLVMYGDKGGRSLTWRRRVRRLLGFPE